MSCTTIPNPHQGLGRSQQPPESNVWTYYNSQSAEAIERHGPAPERVGDRPAGRDGIASNLARFASKYCSREIEAMAGVTQFTEIGLDGAGGGTWEDVDEEVEDEDL